MTHNMSTADSMSNDKKKTTKTKKKRSVSNMIYFYLFKKRSDHRI